MIGIAMAKNKPGPKPHKGDRYASGDLKPAVAPANIKRMVGLAAVGAADPNLASQLGWLRVQKVITDKQMSAGLNFAILVGQHDAMMGFPYRHTRSPSYESGFAGSRSWANASMAEDRIIALRQRYDAAIKSLRDNGWKIEKVLRAVCVDDRAPDWNERPILDIGLNLLITHFGLDRKR